MTNKQGSQDVVRDQATNNAGIVESGSIGELDQLIFEDFKQRLGGGTELNIEEADFENESDEISLEQAVQDYKNGIQEAFDYIFSIYKPRLERLGKRMNDDELAQDLSIVLFKAALAFSEKGGAKFNTFFWKCAQNHIGTQKIRKAAQKRGGNKKANSELLKALKAKEKSGLGLTLEEQHELTRLEEESRPTKTVSLQSTFDTKDSSVEIGSFIEDSNLKNQYKTSVLMTDLESLSKTLKPNEYKAIQMIIDGYTLEEIGKELKGITAPAVHVMLRRLGQKKNIIPRLREILL